MLWQMTVLSWWYIQSWTELFKFIYLTNNVFYSALIIMAPLGALHIAFHFDKQYFNEKYVKAVVFVEVSDLKAIDTLDDELQGRKKTWNLKTAIKFFSCRITPQALPEAPVYHEAMTTKELRAITMRRVSYLTNDLFRPQYGQFKDSRKKVLAWAHKHTHTHTHTRHTHTHSSHSSHTRKHTRACLGVHQITAHQWQSRNRSQLNRL